MNTITLHVPDISCDHCKRTIERELGALRGVQTSSVDVATQRVTVTFDSTHTSVEQIAQTLEDEGYPV